MSNTISIARGMQSLLNHYVKCRLQHDPKVKMNSTYPLVHHWKKSGLQQKVNMNTSGTKHPTAIW